MKKENTPIEQLHEIRSMMEKSTKFISLSGISGIIAGVIALCGAMIQYNYMQNQGVPLKIGKEDSDLLLFSILNFACIFFLALLSALYFTSKKAKKNKQSLWDATSKRLLLNLVIPLLSGGGFCIILYYYDIIGLIASASLVFYGLALVNASNFTLSDIRNLGIAQIILGFISAFYIGYGLLFWAFGFGVLHIIYGIVMYFKYDKN